MQFGDWNCAVLKFSAATLAFFLPAASALLWQNIPSVWGLWRNAELLGIWEQTWMDGLSFTVAWGEGPHTSPSTLFIKRPFQGRPRLHRRPLVPLMRVRLFMTAGLLTFTGKIFDKWETRIHLWLLSKMFFNSVPADIKSDTSIAS